MPALGCGAQSGVWKTDDDMDGALNWPMEKPMMRWMVKMSRMILESIVSIEPKLRPVDPLRRLVIVIVARLIRSGSQGIADSHRKITGYQSHEQTDGMRGLHAREGYS